MGPLFPMFTPIIEKDSFFFSCVLHYFGFCWHKYSFGYGVRCCVMVILKEIKPSQVQILNETWEKHETISFFPQGNQSGRKKNWIQNLRSLVWRIYGTLFYHSSVISTSKNYGWPCTIFHNYPQITSLWLGLIIAIDANEQTLLLS